MQKKLVQSSLALTAAAALGLGSAFIAGPAVAAQKPELDVQGDSALQKVVGEKLSDQSGELKSEIGRFGVKGNTLHIGVAKETSDIEKLDEKYSNVDVTVDPRYVKAEPQAKKDLVGGAGYLTTIPSDSELIGACSTGFAGWDSSGKQVVLTAGHCAEDATTGAQDSIVDMEKPSSADAVGGEGFVPAGTGTPGTWGFHQFGSDIVNGNQVKDIDKAIDLAVINVADGYTNKAEVTNWKSAGSDDLSKSTTKVSKVGAPKVGKSIRKSGRTTGLTSGTVMTGIDDEMPYANIGGRAVHGFEVDPSSGKFSDHGDSGGAVYQGKTAVGVISGGPEEGPAWTWVADLTTGLDKSGESFTFEDPNQAPEPPAAPSAKDQTIEPKGAVTGTAEAKAKVKVTWNGTAKGTKTVKADADGNFTLEGPSAEGDYNFKAVAIVDGQRSEQTSFKVTVKAADDSDSKTDADADAAAAADAKDADAAAAADGDDAKADADADAKNADADADAPEAPEAPVVKDQKVDEGGQITGKTEANAKVELNWKPVTDKQSAVNTQAAANGSVTVAADAEGKFTAEAPSEAGEYAYTATATTDAGTSNATTFTVVVEEAADEADADADSAANGADANAEADADGNDSDAGAAADAKNAESNADSDGSKDGEAPAERQISIEPKEVSASDFVKKDKGVQITVEGFEEGEKVSLEVVAGPENVEGITLDETANENGVAAFSIYGTNASDPSAYLGKYDVQVTGANDTDDEKALAGSFSVVADEDGNGGGGDNGDGGDGGSDLPRTGAELTGLAAGAGLLVVGGAAVVLTMRRNKKN